MKKERLDVHQAITDKIVAALEAGAGEFKLPWHRSGMATMLPRNASSGASYNGINVLSLWASAIDKGYPTSTWATYKQWAALEAQVRQGEKASLVVFYKQFEVDPNPEDEGDDGSRRVAKASFVFNVSQVDGFAAAEPLPTIAPLERNVRADAFITATKADIRYGGEQAFYRHSTDHIQLPEEWAFRNMETRTEDFYSVLNHELGHWTAKKERCDRQLSNRFGDDAYACEELVAEITSAYLCAELGISPQPRADHASYLAHWLKILKADNKAIFSAAARASEAVRYLHSLQPTD